MAALKGIRLDEDGDGEIMTAEEKVEEMKRKAEGRALGKTEDEMDFDELGIDIEVVED